MSRVDEQPSLGRQHLQRSLPVPAAHAGAGENLVKGQAAFFGVDVACELQSRGSACSPELSKIPGP